MIRFKKVLFPLFMLFLFIEIVFIFPAQLEKKPETITASDSGSKDASAPQSAATQQKMEGVHLVESRAGSRDWELFSETAESTSAQGGWKLAKVRVLFYNSEKVDFIVTGNRGNIEAGSKNIQISGQVVTQSSNGYSFYSEEVIYNSEERLISSPGMIKMIGPPDGKTSGLVLLGQNMQTFVQKRLMKINQKVDAEKMLSDGKKFKIKSQQAEFSGENRLAKFTGEVNIDVGTLKLEGPEAQFEYRPGVDILNSVVVNGGIKVSDVDKYATSDSVRFDPEQNKFTFNGRPRVVQNNDEITGDQIIFIDGGKRVKVERVKAKVEKE